MSGIVKRFGGAAANDGIDITLRPGEILALLGENGAGKTTLMNILFGHYVADEGAIEVFGRPLKPGDPKASLQAGIGMVHQHFSLADNLSVLDNVMLGTESLYALRSNRRAARRRLDGLSEEFGFEIEASDLVRDLSVGQKQRVEILKALYRKAKILILDEPTAVLTPQETERLFDILRLLAAKGLSIIFISHKLREILAVCNRIVVLRRGQVTSETQAADADARTLAQAMVGRELAVRKKESLIPGEAALNLIGVALADTRHSRGLDEINLTVREREIVGITGVAGNGQREMADIINGLIRPTSGEIRIFGEHCTALSPQLNAARIPDDRMGSGIVGEMTVRENLISDSYRRRFSRWGFLRFAEIRRRTESLRARYDIRCASLNMEAKLLSGGNIQRLILARELSNEPRVIFVNQPTRGLDVGAIENVHSILLESRARGAGILMITEDLDELFSLSDRIAVMYQGKLSAFYRTNDISPKEIGVLMSGGEGDMKAVFPHAA